MRVTAGSEGPNRTERELLAAARGGEEAALRHLLEAHRADLHAHCYRMLGSQHDADDALQDALLRAWRALPRFQGRSAFRTWLYRIATNACLDLIDRRPKRVLPVGFGPSAGEMAVGPSLPGPRWTESYPDDQLGFQAGHASPEASYERREAVELAFIAALQHLPPRQRVVLILRDVLGFSAREAGRALNTTVAAVNSALQRARRTIDERLPEQGQPPTLRSLADEGTRDHVERFIAAFEGGDVDVILSLLVKDVTFGISPRWQLRRDVVRDPWPMPSGPEVELLHASRRADPTSGRTA
jgi:RNA polymerase sigma-70 factor (ECF subfamily)